MDTLIEAIQARKSIIVTSLQGFERSRFLLRSELILLSNLKLNSSFKRIVHVCDKDQTLNRLLFETQQLPFEEFGIKIAKYYCVDNDTNKSDSLEFQSSAQLIFCSLHHILNEDKQLVALDVKSCIVVFDGLSLENIESSCCMILEERFKIESNDEKATKVCLPSQKISELSSVCWSIVLACNPPVEGIEAEFGCKFPVVLSDSPLAKQNFRTIASILARGPDDIPLKFNASDKDPRIHDQVGSILEGCANRLKSGGIVIFFPTYGRMVDYHHAWQKSGLFDRLKLPYGRENRGGDLFKNGLLKLVKEEKFIFMLSIRYHQDEALAEFALSQAKVVLVLGLPYPITSDTWNSRIKYNDDAFLAEKQAKGRLSGSQMFKYRAIELMNGVLKRCLSDLRHHDCAFFLADCDLEFERNKIAKELGDVQEESVHHCLDRLTNFERSGSIKSQSQ